MFKIKNRIISRNHKPFIIVELSGNHNGSLKTALKIVDLAAKAGADAIKLQTYTADTITMRSSRKEFWYWQLFRILMFLSITFIESLGLSGLLFISNFIFLIPEIAVSIRRLHDINKSGWWILLTLTIIGIIPLTYFYCIKGDDGVNDYGQPN